MKKLFIIALSLMVITACKKTEETLEPEEYIIFGKFNDFCMGEKCVEMYMLTASKLYEDTVDYGGSDYIELSEALFAAVFDIEDAIPAELIAQPDSTFGCPSCLDQGGVRLEIKKDGIVNKWTIDNDLDAIPAYLHSFVALIHEKVQLIND